MSKPRTKECDAIPDERLKPNAVFNRNNSQMTKYNNYPEKLCKHLISKGYDASSISERNTNLYGLELSLLEVKSAKYVIQTFVLMSNEARNSRSRVPIYKTYTQETPKGNVIYPACCIACFDGNDWSFFNASETCEPCRGEFVNYDKAKERFNTRLDVENKCSKVEKLSIHSRIAGCLLLALLAGFFVIKNEILLNNNVVVLLIASVILFLLPDILGLVQKVSIKDIEIVINKGMN